ncbi:hypothetical protein NQZ68_004749 [Dissostichus eleginoides]|nr:hypothetical protein NQZ68_004749 [Dissostichus eleginoides]
MGLGSQQDLRGLQWWTQVGLGSQQDLRGLQWWTQMGLGSQQDLRGLQWWTQMGLGSQQDLRGLQWWTQMGLGSQQDLRGLQWWTQMGLGSQQDLRGLQMGLGSQQDLRGLQWWTQMGLGISEGISSYIRGSLFTVFGESFPTTMAGEPEKAWSSALLDCFEDMNTCCYGFWCGPCLACTVSGRFGENYCFPLCDIVPICTTAMIKIPICVPPAALSTRAAMRSRYHIRVRVLSLFVVLLVSDAPSYGCLS